MPTCALSLPPWYPCHTETNNLMFCLAWYQLRYSPLGSILHKMSRWRCIDTLWHTLFIPYPRCILYINIVGPLRYLLSCYTCRSEAISLFTITSECCSIFHRCVDLSLNLMCPSLSLLITDDNLSPTSGQSDGSTRSHLWNNLMALLGTKISCVTLYHPQAKWYG